MALMLEGKTVRHVEAQAMKGVDPNYGTRGKRRNLIRLAIRDGKCCAHCGDPVYFIWEKKTNPNYSKAKMATFDHIILKKDGGTYKLENGLLACYDCNNLRGDMPLDTFRKRIAEGKWEPYSKRKEKKLRKKARREARRLEQMESPKTKLFIVKLATLLFLIEKRDKYYYENLPGKSVC